MRGHKTGQYEVMKQIVVRDNKTDQKEIIKHVSMKGHNLNNTTISLIKEWISAQGKVQGTLVSMISHGKGQQERS